MESPTVETALASEVVLPLLEGLTSEEQSHLTLPHNLTPLHYACQHGRVDVAKLLLNNYKYSIERRDVNGCTPLHTAAQYGQLEVFKYLLQILFTSRGTHLQLRVDSKLCHTLMSVYQETLSERHRDLSGNTPLHTASKHGSVDIVQLLIQEIGCDPQDRNKKGMSCLGLAAQYGHLPLVKYLTTQYCDLFRKSSTTSLLLATESGHLDIVKFFIEELHCDPNSKDTQEMTLLHHASKHGHLNTVKYLVETQKFNPLCPDKKLTPLHVATYFGHLEVVKYFTIDQHCDPLVKNVHKNTPLHSAALNGRIDVVKFLIEDLGCDPDSRGELGRNSLHCASNGGHLNTIKYLVEEQKCDILCPGEDACTPLHVAAFFGHLEVIKYFTIDQHCTPLMENVSMVTPLHFAALEGRLDVVNFLIEKLECDPNIMDWLNRIPLHYASKGGHLNIIKYLVETQKCDPLLQDINNNTPFHFAALYGNTDIASFFIDVLNCDPNIRGMSGNTPLHLALKSGNIHVSIFLVVQKNCNVLSPNADGVTPFLLAVGKGYYEIVQQMMHTHRIDPYTQPDKKALLSAARDSGMLEYFSNYVDPLHQAAINGDMDTVRHYIERVQWSPLVRDRRGNNLLHTAAKHGQLGVVKYLTGTNLEHSHNIPCPVTVDFTIKNKNGLTAKQLAKKEHYLHVVSFIHQSSCNQPPVKHLALPPSVNILVIGNTGSGKSTLVKALSQDKSILGRLTQVKSVQPLTAGIIPTTISSQDFGKVNIYDFAGHEEYYASHEMILHQTTQPLVLIAVNISLSMADIEKQLCYWLSILSNAKNDHAMHVLVIGSHADKTSNACIQKVEEKANLFAANEGGIIYRGFVHCDCRYSVSNSMSQLRHMLSEINASIRLSLSYSHTSLSNSICMSLMDYLDSFKPDNKAATLTINQLQQQIKSIKSPGPNMERLTDQELLVQTCKSLSVNGHLIFLSHDTDVGKSLLLTDEKTILSKVHACLGRIEQCINSLGIIEEQQLKKVLTSSLKDTMDPSLAVKYLLIAQFCTEVTPDQLTSVPHGVNEQATHYFFPNLVLAERPAQLWTSAEEDKYTHLYTWCLRCSNPRHFFTPRYLHTLFIQLIKCDSTGNAKYTIWKNGILLVHGNGTRCVIEVTHQVTQLSLVMQCLKSKGHETQLVKQRSLLISLIKSLKSRVCPKLELTEFLLLSDHTSDAAIEIPVSEVARSVVAGLPSVPYYENEDRTLPKHATISELLCFESFHFISSPQILQDIFRNCHSYYPVSEDTMASLFKSCGELVEKLHLESGCNVEDITYRQLYTELAKHSIFTDENIYVLAGMDCSRIKSEQENDNSLMEQDMSQLSSPLELVDLYEVNVKLVSIIKLKEFGLALGLSGATLEKIRANFQSVEQCLTEVLAALLKGQDRPHNSPLNWKEVINTLNSPSLNMRDRAKTLVQNLMRDKDKDKDNGVAVSTVDDSVLDSHSLMEVKMSLFSLKHKWFHLGLSLGLSYGTLKIIEQSPNEDHLTEVLVKWLDQADMTLTRGPPSWRSLAAVLDCPLVQEHDVARNIKKDHPMDLVRQ